MTGQEERLHREDAAVQPGDGPADEPRVPEAVRVPDGEDDPRWILHRVQDLALGQASGIQVELVRLRVQLGDPRRMLGPMQHYVKGDAER